jgi:HK97 gp10 family phage protein
MLRSRLDTIAATLDEEIDSAIRNLAEEIVVQAKAKVPVGDDPPHLRDAIHLERDAEGSYRVVAGDERLFYGHIIEFGSVDLSPRPFLLPALEAARAKIDDTVKAALKDL